MAKCSRHFTQHACRALYSEKSRAFGQGFRRPHHFQLVQASDPLECRIAGIQRTSSKIQDEGTNALNVIYSIEILVFKVGAFSNTSWVFSWILSGDPCWIAPSVGVFKKELFSIIRPCAKSTFGIHDRTGLSYLTQLSVSVRKVNVHKVKYNVLEIL